MWNAIIFGWLYFFGILATAAAVSTESKKYPWGVFFVAALWPLTIPVCSLLAIGAVVFVRRGK